MKELEDRILKDGKVLPGDIVKVGSFLNQQIDIKLLEHMAQEVKKNFDGVTKVLTIETSGLPLATMVSYLYSVDMVFAKKSKTANVDGEFVTAEVASFTHGNTNTIYINKEYIKPGDKVLIVDDFLALGNALKGLITLCDKCGASVVGCAVQIEKEYQGGGNLLRDQGYKVLSLAQIKEIKDTEIIF